MAFQHVLTELEQTFAGQVERELGLSLQLRVSCEPKQPILFNAELNTLFGDRLVNLDEADTAEIVFRVYKDPDVRGGVADYLSVDAFAALACHELGHAIGGLPVYEDNSTFRQFFAAGKTIEGQADYYVASCLRKLWRANGRSPEELDATSDPIARGLCGLRYQKRHEQALCTRIAQAGLELMQFFERTSSASPAAWKPELSHLSFATPDRTVMSEMLLAHPSLQCRADTILAAALEQPRPRCWYANAKRL